MLRQLYIKNFAIISDLRIDFTDHLNIITGETGAGKSILMGALGMVLGDRADSSTLLDKEKKCIVEAYFSLPEKNVVPFLKENNLDIEEELIVRRELTGNGKSRAFINDTPVNLAQLKQLGSYLVNLHRQFDTLDLIDRDFQTEVIDALADNGKLLQQYHQVYDQYREISRHLNDLREKDKLATAERDYDQFLYDELENAHFTEDEAEQLEDELKLLDHTESIKENLSEILYLFQDGEEPMIQQLKQAINKIEGISDLIPKLDEIKSRLQSAYIELKDIADEIDMTNEQVHFDPEKLEKINDRLSVAYSLFQKHQVKSTEELLAVQASLSQKLEEMADRSFEIEKLEKQQQQLRKDVDQYAAQLTQARKKQAPLFADKVNKLLRLVGMPNAAIKVSITAAEQPQSDGMDIISFLFNANKTTFEPIGKVASGGELSRLMLIIRSLVAKKIHLPTLIFDEIDTGISGEAARQVGLIIKDLSVAHQVLLITHQPQIAAKAFTHFYVYKEEKDGKILTSIRRLSDEERIEEIATMLSGKRPTSAAFENAKEMIAEGTDR